MRIILVISLVLFVTPTFASTLLIENASSAQKSSVNNIMGIAFAFDSQAYTGETAINKVKNCKGSCCADGNCFCENACLDFTASQNLPLFSSNNAIFSMFGDSAGLPTALDIHPSNNFYPPILRPPIF